MKNKQVNDNVNSQNNVPDLPKMNGTSQPVQNIPNGTPNQVQGEQIPIPQKKNNFNGEERILYEIKPDVEASAAIPILFFLCLFSMIFALPYISKKLSFQSIGVTPGTTVVPDSDPNEFYYFDRSSVRARIGGLEFTNFVKSYIDNEYKVSFTMTNTNEKTYQFDKKYYLILYDDDRILYRALIHSYEGVGSLDAKTFSLIINENSYINADKFKIEEIAQESYPAINLIETSGEYEVMECNYRNNKIKYYFVSGELAKIYDEYTEQAQNNKNYNDHRNVYRLKSEEYKKVNNFSSVFIETDEYFTMINEFNLDNITEATITQLRTYRFFNYKVSKDIVSFELEAQGYTCS